MRVLSYVELLRDPRWQRKRLKILERDDWKCVWCGDTQNNLQVDHAYYERGRKPWEADDSTLHTLCADCHRRVGELRARANKALGGFNVYELPIVVAIIERMHETGRNAVSSVHVERLEAERDAILSKPFTKKASRRLDVIDHDLDQIWQGLLKEERAS